jgi:thiol-disulfide isomerase/thioredoxin
MALVRPHAALALAGNRKHAGRSGSDLLGAIAILVICTQLRGVLAALWLGQAVSWTLGGRALLQLLQGTLTIDLGVLVVAAAVIFAASGRRREVGRAFDLACVALVPLVFVQLVAMVAAHFADATIPAAVVYGPGLAWTGALVALGGLEGRRGGASGDSVPRAAKVAGVAVALVAAAGGWWQAIWIYNHVDYVRPMTAGAQAPAFSLPAVGPEGALGPPVTLASTKGKIVVIDFWATWCGPCLQSMPRLDALAHAHPDVVVLAVNLDNPKAARELFDERKYAMTLVADDSDVSERYGVSAIPHTVIVDRTGQVRAVSRGGDADLEMIVAHLQ